MKCIHLCSDYANQKIYRELITHLEAVGIEQFIYIAVRRMEDINRNRNDTLQNAKYHYSYLLKPIDRVLFRRKIKRVFYDLTSSVDVTKYSLVHAHFLYSDGAVALRLKKKFRIPYIVAVRNTDINYFMKYRPDLRYLARRILEEANRIIFITPKYLDLLMKRVPVSMKKIIKNKSNIVPNGLSDYWLDNCHMPKADQQGPLRLLYIGAHSRNKNITNLLLATALLRDEMDVRLTLVGGGGDGEKQLERALASGRYDYVENLGRIDNLDRLLEIYRGNDVFVMPSFHETFGVVYLEALSQGLPIIYSRGQGIDGYFEPKSVGEAVDPNDPVDIKKKILSVAGRRSAMSSRCRSEAGRFKWSRIAETYAGIYKRAME